MADKVRLPKKIKVGIANYDVLYPYTYVDDSGNFGTHESFCNKIKITEYWTNGKLNYQLVLSTFIHEIVHAIDLLYVGNVFDEYITEKFEKAFFQVLIDNDIRFCDDDYISDKIKIGGYVYNVVYPHSFVDAGSGVVYSSSSEGFDIFLSDDERLDKKMLKLGLMNVIVTKMVDYYIGDYKEYEITNRDEKLLSHGIYQVFKDNKIEELVKKYCCSGDDDNKKKKRKK